MVAAVGLPGENAVPVSGKSADGGPPLLPRLRLPGEDGLAHAGQSATPAGQPPCQSGRAWRLIFMAGWLAAGSGRSWRGAGSAAARLTIAGGAGCGGMAR